MLTYLLTNGYPKFYSMPVGGWSNCDWTPVAGAWRVGVFCFTEKHGPTQTPCACLRGQQ